jgi:hypothetical protein
MTTQKIFFTFVILSLFQISNIANAQFSASFGPGVASYSGDVSGEKFKNARPTFNAELWYQMNRNLYLKSGVSIYQIFATDVFPERNRAFKATNFELYTSLMLGANPDWRLMPFAYAGIGFSTNSPEYALLGENGANYLDAKALNTENERIPGAIMTLPTGVGFRFRLNEKLAIVADAGLRFTNTDLLDGVSAASIDVSTLTPQAVNYFEAIRPNGLNGANVIGNGNPDKNDVYGIFSVKLQFKLNRNNNTNSMPCPPFYSR